MVKTTGAMLQGFAKTQWKSVFFFMLVRMIDNRRVQMLIWYNTYIHACINSYDCVCIQYNKYIKSKSNLIYVSLLMLTWTASISANHFPTHLKWRKKSQLLKRNSLLLSPFMLLSECSQPSFQLSNKREALLEGLNRFV